MANLNLSEFTEKLFVADADHTFIWDSAASISKRVSRNSWLNSGTLTSDAPVTISQTWGTTGTYTAAKVNVTETATANAASLLLDLQVGGASKFKVQKDGHIYVNNINSRLDFFVTNVNAFTIFQGQVRCYMPLVFSNDGAFNDTFLLRDGAPNTLALRNGALAQTFRVYNTYSNGGIDFERLNIQWSGGAARIFPDAGGTGTLKTVYLGSDSVANNAFLVNGASNLVQINTSGAERMRITSAGNVGIGTTSPTSKLQVSAGDVEVDTIAKGVILKSPDDTRYRVTVANGGTLSVAAV